MANGLFSRYEHAQRKYKKIKENPELYEKLLERRRKAWKKINPKSKEKLYERVRNYRKEMREVAKDLGNCTQCFQEKDNPKFNMCSKCRKRHRDFQNKKSHANLETHADFLEALKGGN